MTDNDSDAGESAISPSSTEALQGVEKRLECAGEERFSAGLRRTVCKTVEYAVCKM